MNQAVDAQVYKFHVGTQTPRVKAEQSTLMTLCSRRLFGRVTADDAERLASPDARSSASNMNDRPRGDPCSPRVQGK